MKAILLRTGSVPVHSSFLPGSPRVSVPVRHDSFSGREKTEFPASPKIISLHLDVNNNRRGIGRAVSEPEMMIRSRLAGGGSQTFPVKIPEAEEECLSEDDDFVEGIGSLAFAEKCLGTMSWPPVEELGGFSGVGSGGGRDPGGFGGEGYSSGSDRSKMSAYYQQMLKLNPADPLLLRNYGKFLHEVEGDYVKAEECYGRAILASPGDGEVLSLYGKLIWETQRDGERAKSYFDQAISVSPDDCMVMGSYAEFMWEAEEDEDSDEKDEYGSGLSVAAPLVAAC